MLHLLQDTICYEIHHTQTLATRLVLRSISTRKVCIFLPLSCLTEKDKPCKLSHKRFFIEQPPKLDTNW
jgi:hypothetical protein